MRTYCVRLICANFGIVCKCVDVFVLVYVAGSMGQRRRQRRRVIAKPTPPKHARACSHKRNSIARNRVRRPDYQRHCHTIATHPLRVHQSNHQQTQNTTHIQFRHFALGTLVHTHKIVSPQTHLVVYSSTQYDNDDDYDDVDIKQKCGFGHRANTIGYKTNALETA